MLDHVSEERALIREEVQWRHQRHQEEHLAGGEAQAAPTASARGTVGLSPWDQAIGQRLQGDAAHDTRIPVPAGQEISDHR